LPHVPAHKIVTARRASDARKRTRLMAEVMREAEAAQGACRISDLSAKGFSLVEQFAYADDARAILVRGDVKEVRTPSPAKAEGMRLVAKARRIRRRNAAAGAAS
jgi:hypothetical protein